MKHLTHTNKQGKAEMVDVSEKTSQKRTAVAEGIIFLQPQTIELIRQNEIKKGDVLTVSEIAGVQAAKRTSDWIPLCHPLQLDQIHVETELVKEGVKIRSKVIYTGKTGVEMEALTAVNAALLSVYDMCKAVDKKMEMGQIRLITKQKEDIAHESPK